MKPTEDSLKTLLDRHLPTPSPLELAASHDRLLRELRSAPPHLQQPRVADAAPPVAWWRPTLSLAAAAAIIAIVAAMSFQRGDWIATVEAADGSRYTLDPNEVLRLTDGDAMLTLTDGSRVEMRSKAELSLEREGEDLGIRLRAGDIIVDAADRGAGRLVVHTKDMTVAVTGTVFLVNAGADGSRVAVIEGTVSVREGTLETTLEPGEQVATSPTLAGRSMTDDLTWSRNAPRHFAILATFQKGMTNTAGRLEPLKQSAQGGVATAAREFEEASVRACDPDNLPPSPVAARGGGANSVMMTPGRYYALCVTPATLIRLAYGYRAVEIEALLPDGPPAPRGGRAPIRGRFGVVGSIGAESGLRVRGGPDWVRTERFTIEAVANDAATTEAMSGPMLRALFEQRFRLRMHVETEQTPAFDLVVAPGGLKIKPVASGSCEMPVGKPGAPLLNGMPQGTPRTFADVRRGQKPTCGVSGGVNGPNWVSVAGEATLGQLTQLLRGRLATGVAVTDKTGITDKFNWDLEYVVDGNAPNAPTGLLTGLSDAAGVPRAPTIFDALEQQLGLRLAPVRVPREFIVIDAIERPSPN